MCSSRESPASPSVLLVWCWCWWWWWWCCCPCPCCCYSPALRIAEIDQVAELRCCARSHPLLVHSGGINAGGGVRLAVVQDFQRIRPRGTLIWQVEGAVTPNAAPTKADVVQPDGRVPFPPGVDVTAAGGNKAKLRWHQCGPDSSHQHSRPAWFRPAGPD